MSRRILWLPLAARVAEGNLFPDLAAIDVSSQGFLFYPYLALWVHGLLIFLFGINGAYFIGHTILPLAGFVIFYKLEILTL